MVGEFDRTLSLPVRLDPDHIKAEYRNGILALYLPRAEASRSAARRLAQTPLSISVAVPA
jgi:HSP20 family molecular chaperone IbpA